MKHLVRLASGVLGVVAFFSLVGVLGGLMGLGPGGKRPGLSEWLPVLLIGISAAVSSDRLYRYSKRPPPELRGFDVLPPVNREPPDRN